MNHETFVNLLTGDEYWPFECTSSRQCWSSAVSKYEGWENYDVKFLACDIESGFCKCKQGYMDADDDRYNGCETKDFFKFIKVTFNGLNRSLFVLN